jgi:hypothetical protein
VEEPDYEPPQLLLTLGVPGGEDLRPLWSRPLQAGSAWDRFWRKPAHRHGLEVGLAIFLGGMLVLGAAWLQRATGAGGAAGWLNEHANLLVILGSLTSLSLLRLVTTPLRLRRARGACFSSGIVTAVPDLLGLVTGGSLLRGVGWTSLASYRDHAERVDLYREGARFPALRLPVLGEDQRTQLLELLDGKGLTRREE